MACKRNAFVMLCNSAPELAVEYLESVINQVPNFDELLQMAVVDLIRKDCKNNAANKVHQTPATHSRNTCNSRIQQADI
jgi:coatomer subunit beta